MAHPQQVNFCQSVVDKFPSKFQNKVVYDFGSLDVNGNNRYLFYNCEYVGIDLGEGKNVDVVSKAHEFKPTKKADVCVSTEMLEHDIYWDKSLQNMLRLLKKGGVFLITCATTGRGEHGTTNSKSPFASPFTNEYYKNISDEMFLSAVDVKLFSEYELTGNERPYDLYFWGIKK